MSIAKLLGPLALVTPVVVATSLLAGLSLTAAVPWWPVIPLVLGIAWLLVDAFRSRVKSAQHTAQEAIVLAGERTKETAERATAAVEVYGPAALGASCGALTVALGPRVAMHLAAGSACGAIAGMALGLATLHRHALGAWACDVGRLAHDLGSCLWGPDAADEIDFVGCMRPVTRSSSGAALPGA